MKRMILAVLALSLTVFGGTPLQAEDNVIVDGKTVKFDYTLTVNGTVADSSEGKVPLEYVHGKNMIIPGLEKKLAGLKVGDEQEIVVSPDEGYGQVNPQMIIEVPKANLPPEVEPQKGMVLQMTTQTGQALPGIIEEVKDETVALNFNHPLAGQELAFKIKIVEIN
ncbi:MAG: peptidylprolyl isomerase [Candidatus Omnitrophica bacterium]|nr:peptidylprolyl isomerase [Candidatus Omnitrophota bacterium]MCB9747504.1 peptidylprolyl isomerase [Candidatus Omnitrophota bacterium]